MPANPRHSNQPATFDPAPRRRATTRPERRPGARRVAAGLALALAAAALTAVPAQPAAAANAGVGVLPNDVVFTPGDGSFTLTWGDWDDETVVILSDIAWRIKDTDTTMTGDQPGSWRSEGINNHPRFATAAEIAAKSLTVVSSLLTNGVTYEVRGKFSWEFHGSGAGIVKIGEVTPTAGGSTPTTTVAATPPTTLTLTTSAASNTVAEGGESVTVTATLNTAATTAVSVTLTATGSATSGSDYTLPAAFEIAAGNTAATGTIQITDDHLDEDNETIILSTTVSGLTVTGVTLTIADDDTAGVTRSTNTVSVAEGATATYTVVLDSQPTASVTVTPTSATTAKATVAPASVTFTASNWDMAKTFTVTGVDAGTSAITHAATSTDADYGIPTVGTVTATVTATATPPSTLTLTTNAASNTVAEGGGSVTVTATLDQPATATVSVTLTATGTATSGSDYTLPSAFTIAAGQTMASGSVQITDDDLDEDSETVVLSASGTGLTVTGVTLTITDDDTAGVTLSETSRSVEVGATTTYTVVLDSEPTASVTVTPTSGSMDKATVAPATRVFTTSNWETPQMFTVTGVAVGMSAITHAATSSDADYAIMTVGTVTATVGASTKTFRIESTKTVAEGSAASLTVTLGQAAPSGGLSLSVAYGYSGSAAASSADLGASAPSSVTVSSGSTTATLRVPTNNDSLVEGDETFTVTLSTAVSGWAAVSGEAAATVTVTDDDDDNARIGFGASGRTTAYTRSVAEDTSGGVLNVPVQVSHLPQASTTVTVEVRTGGTATEYQSAQSPGDFRIATKSVTFTATGNRTQNLAVTITDDMLVEDDQTILLRIANSGSSGMDSHYSRHASGRLATVTIADDDDDDARIAFGASATASSAHTESVDEDVSGGSLSVPVTINRRPETSTVFSVQVVAQGANRASEYVSAQNPGDFQIATKSVTFGPTGALSKNLTVSVTDDDWVEEDQTIVLRIVDSPASGANSLGRHYSRHNAAKTATLTITDDDADDAKIAIPNSPSFSFDTDFGMRLSGLNLVEGSNVGVPVQVSHLPEASTVFSLSVVSAGTTESSAEYTITTMSVTFGPNTAKQQQMNVVSVDDDLVEHDKTIAVRLDDSPNSGTNKLGRHYTRNAQSRQATLNVDDVFDQQAAKIAFHASDASSTAALAVSVDEDDGIVDVPVTVSLLPEASTTFTVEVLETLTRPATQYTNSANPGDYRVLGNKTVTFGSTGAKTKNVRVQLTNNALVEHPETVQLRIVVADSPNNDLGDYYNRHVSSRLATLTVADDDAAAATIAIGNSASSTAKYTVARSEDHSQGGLVIPIRVSHAPSEATTFALEILAAGTATENTDYAMPLKEIVFTPSGLTDSVPVSFTDDDWVEDDQTIEVRIVAADATVDDLGDYYTRHSAGATGTVTIEDDEQREAKIAFGTATRTSVYTANGEEVVGTLTVPVAINHLPESSTTFAVEVLDSSTARETDDPANASGNPKDFGIASKTVTYGPTTGKSMNLTITVANDTVEEDDEQIRLRIVAKDAPVNDLGDHYDRHAAGSTANVTVKSEDAVAEVTLSTTAALGPRNDLYPVYEGTEMTLTATADIPVGPGGWTVTPRMKTYAFVLSGFASAADVRFAPFTIPEGQTTATGKVTIVSDSIAEPQEILLVQGAARRRARSLEAALSGATAQGGLRVQISDSGAGATVSTTAVEIVEAETAAYTVVLNEAPTADVVVTPSSSRTAQATVSGALTFTTANWDTAQPVTVTGVGDGAATISHSVTSADLTYNGLSTVLDVKVKVLEPAQTYSLAVKATGARSAVGTEGTPIELEVTLDDLAPTGGLAFTIDQITTQGVTPTAVTVAEGERRVSFDAGITDDEVPKVTLQARTVTISTAVSGWTAKTPTARDVSLSFEDNDGGEATVAFGAGATPTGAHLVTVAENVSAGALEVPVTISGGTSTDITFDVAVLSDSTATMRSTCDMAGADFAIADRTITFAPTDGLTKNLTVTICDDDAVEPDETIRLGFAPARSPARTVADLYARRPAGNLQAVITIDSEDAPTEVRLRTTGGYQHGTVQEGSTFAVTATLDKAADVGGVAVNLRVASSPASSAAAGTDYRLPNSFIIGAGQTSATAQIQLLDDDQVDGTKSLRLTATTTPTLMLVWSPPSVPYMDITINDTDSPGITFSDAIPTVARGQSTTYTVRLNTRPSASVSVEVAVGDSSVATVTPATLTFTPQNFRAPQTVRVRGVSEGSTDITHTTTSTDSAYNGRAPTAAVTVTTPTTTTGGGPTGGGPTGGGPTGGGPTGGGPTGGGPTGGGPTGGTDEDPSDEDPADEPDRLFADVAPAGVHSGAIGAIAAAGITAGCGTEPVRYCPDMAVTRAQMATFLVRALDLQVPEEPAGFADTDPDSVHSAHIEALAAAGITAGCGTEPVRYCPDSAVTRAQMATFLVRALDLQVPEEPAGFADVDPDSVHSAHIEALAAAGITAGCGTDPLRYCPDRAVTRAEMATFLARALDLQPSQDPQS